MIFACPVCQGSLTREHNFLYCLTCERKWPFLDGIPTFGQSYPYTYNPLESVYAKLNKLSATMEWQKALGKLLSKEDDDVAAKVMREIYDESKADWKLLLEIKEDTIALVLGSGSSAVPFSLVKGCKQVYSLEYSLPRVKFLDIRVKQSGLKNIASIWASHTRYLPFTTRSVDLTCIYWSALGIMRWAQKKRFLTEVSRILKRGGCLFVADRNRILTWLLHLKKDSIHNGSDCVSIKCYKRILAKLGFVQLSVYCLYPDYENLTWIIPLANPTAFRAIINIPVAGLYGKSYSVKRNIATTLARLGFLENLVPSFGIIATKM